MSENDQILLVGRLTKSRLNLKSMLDQVARKAIAHLQADACALLLLDESKQILTLKSSHGLSSSAVDVVRLPKDVGVSWRIVREKKYVALEVAKDDPDFHSVPVSEEEKYVSMMGVPIMEEGECIGVLYVQSVEPREYTQQEISKLESISEEVAGAIKVASDFERLEKKTNVLTRLNETEQLIDATNNIDEIISLVVRCAEELIGAKTQIVWLDGQNGELALWNTPEPDGAGERTPPALSGIVSSAVNNREVVVVPDINSDKRFENLDRVAATSVVCSPMIFEDQVVGVILLADRVTERSDYFAAFSSEEIQILTTLSQKAAQAVARAQTHRRLKEALDKNEQNVKELSILFQLSMAMRRTLNLDDLLRVIISCVTVGHGLGFNRAILFLVNEKAGYMQGMIGMGPDSAEHAGRIWRDLDQQPPDDLVPWLLNRDVYEIQHSEFNQKARSCRFLISGPGASEIITKVVKHKVAVNIRGPEELTQGDRELMSSFIGCDRFAIAPLVARDTVLGAILVDNMYNSIPITDADMELLTRFAAPAAWAIENMKLFEKWVAVSEERLDLENQMARVERMSALGEVSAELAHELKNPLVSIGGFARRLSSGVSDPETNVKYASIIVEEVERLETLLHNVLDLSKDVSIRRVATDLNLIVRDSVDFYSRLLSGHGIKVQMDLDPNLEKVLIDPAWIKQVVINLILNAMEAMSCDRHKVKRNLKLTTEAGDDNGSVARLKISDTGGGIADEDFHNVFNPFFTTKPQGTGLGLPLCKKMVQLHQGSLEIDNKLGDGVTFTINLHYEPLSKSQND